MDRRFGRPIFGAEARCLQTIEVVTEATLATTADSIVFFGCKSKAPTTRDFEAG